MIKPLFIPIRGDLEEALGLNGIDLNESRAAQLDSSIKVARTTFFRRLGSSTITLLISYTSTDSPSTSNEYLRAIAEDVELKLVKRELLQYYNHLLMEQGNGGVEAWNEDPFLRKFSSSDTAKEYEALTTSIEQDMSLLAGETSIGDETSVRSAILEPDIKPLPPGATTWPRSVKALWT
jgi:hypothetical protein